MVGRDGFGTTNARLVRRRSDLAYPPMGASKWYRPTVSRVSAERSYQLSYRGIWIGYLDLHQGGAPNRTPACYLCHTLSYPHQELSLGLRNVKPARFRYAMGAWCSSSVSIGVLPLIRQVFYAPLN